MSITPIGTVAKANYNSATKTSTLAAPFTQDVPAGLTLAVAITVEGVGGVAAVASAVDSRGNPYSAGPSESDLALRQVLWLYAPVTTKILATDNLTVTIKDGSGTLLPRNRWNIVAMAFSGVAASPLDTTAVATGGGLHLYVGPTGTPSQAEGVFLAAYDVGPSQSVTAGPNATVGGTSTTAGTGTSNDHQLVTTYQLVPSGGTPAALTTADTQATTSNWAGAAMFLKAASTQALTVTSVTATGAWTLTPSSGQTAPSIVSDASDATYLESPSNPVGSASYETFALSTPSPIPTSTDTFSISIRHAAISASTGSVDVTFYRGGTTVVHAFTGQAVPLTGVPGWLTITLTSADIAAITAAVPTWAGLTFRVAPTVSP